MTMKKYLFLLLIAFVPTMLLAQAAGGAVKRPVKKAQATTTTSKSKSRAGMSKADKDRILQNLINNMVYVEGGTFTMGATEDQKGESFYYGEETTHMVTLSPFSIGKFEVTQEEWIAVMGNNPSKFKGTKQPVEQVSWEDCQEFIRQINSATGKHFRLPSEAEWEYAARGGKYSNGYKYAGSNKIDNVAWYFDNSGINGEGTHSVGQKSPNEIGLYDMSGNVEEWCQDWFSYYSSDQQNNPTGPSSSDDPTVFGGYERIYRGGWFGIQSAKCRISSRNTLAPHQKDKCIGFRLAL